MISAWAVSSVGLERLVYTQKVTGSTPVPPTIIKNSIASPGASPYDQRTMLMVAQVIIASLLSLCILLQHRTSGLTATFGGGGATFVQRRGAEKFIFVATIWLSVLFFGFSIAQWYITF